MKIEIPKIIVPIIKNDEIIKLNINEELQNKKVIIFGVPGAFTPTCSEKHFPGFIKLFSSFKEKKIDDVYCLSVNDHFVMKAWLSTYNENKNIIGIADGNADITKEFDLLVDKSANFMGKRSNRFAMIVENNIVLKIFIEKPGEFNVSSAEKILENL
tara:strand:+ start:219 stop:689 length:471 start_codon:yes stop_codon:yes gene_type:complete